MTALDGSCRYAHGLSNNLKIHNSTYQFLGHFETWLSNILHEGHITPITCLEDVFRLGAARSPGLEARIIKLLAVGSPFHLYKPLPLLTSDTSLQP